MPKPSVATGIVFGAIGGVTTMLANAGGPAWQMHLLPQKIEKLPYIGTVSILFAASNIVKVPAFATLGFLTRENMLVGLTLGADRGPANYAGIWMVRRVSTEMFFRIAYVLMFVIAVELIRSSVVELCAPVDGFPHVGEAIAMAARLRWSGRDDAGTGAQRFR